MSSLTTRRPRVKPQRFLRLLAPDLVRITAGKAIDTYHVVPMPSDLGPAFAVAKLLHADELSVEYAPAYDVCLGDADTSPSCSCQGYLRHGHCRHVDALAVLRRLGRLPA